MLYPCYVEDWNLIFTTRSACWNFEGFDEQLALTGRMFWFILYVFPIVSQIESLSLAAGSY